MKTDMGFIRTSLMQIAVFITLFALHVSDVIHIHPQDVEQIV